MGGREAGLTAILRIAYSKSKTCNKSMKLKILNIWDQILELIKNQWIGGWMNERMVQKLFKGLHTKIKNDLYTMILKTRCFHDN